MAAFIAPQLAKEIVLQLSFLITVTVEIQASRLITFATVESAT